MSMKVIKLITSLFLASVLFVSCSNKIKNPDWVINEVMVTNETNFMDNFGQRSAWIEIYNNTAGTMDLGGRYLTNDHNNPTKYAIPRGDILTRIKPHQHALFWADEDRKSTRLNSSHVRISYAVFCLKKKSRAIE